MFDTIKRIREKNAQLFCGSAIILALSISGCTTSGTSLLEGAAKDIAVAETNNGEPAKDGAPANTQLAATTDTAPKTAAEAARIATAQAQTEPAVQPLTAAAATNQIVQTAVDTTTPEAPVEKPSTLAALFGTRSKPTAALAAATATATPATQSTQTKQPDTTQQTATDSETIKAEVNAKAVPPVNAPALDRTSQSAGAAARLFAPGKNSPRGEANGRQQPSVIASVPAKNTSDYNFTLPGVRANSGFEIRHSNKVFDESDIDLDEDDFSAPVTLASAGGMARLAPNGLRTQHDKVQVSCLKPQLVSMIKRLETHYRKPVVITSGYRSPAHNRSVSGAKRSLHMSCSAADLQIPGVSKWEIARQVRTWPGRGGVGTYCHTESIHIDVGPERDWNWRCRRG